MAGFSSCASYQQSTQDFRNSWDLGDETQALSHLEKAGQSIQAGDDEELLWNMEMVTVSRSNQINELTDYHIARAKSITEKNFGGGLLDPKSKGIGEYIGYFYDRNMLEIYRTIRALETKNNSRAQSALTELKFKRQEAEEINRARIVEIVSKAKSRTDLKYKEFLKSGKINQNELINEEIAEKYQEFYNPMGDYLRLVLTNRGGEQFDFGTNKENLALANRIEQKNQTKYFEGVASSFELREAQLQLYSTQNNYIKAIQNVIQKKLALETLLNTPQQ